VRASRGLDCLNAVGRYPVAASEGRLVEERGKRETSETGETGEECDLLNNKDNNGFLTGLTGLTGLADCTPGHIERLAR